MKSVNIHEAKTQLSRLITAAMAGEPLVIAKAGKPLIKVEALPEEGAKPERIGFLKGKLSVPDDFDTMGADEIIVMFEGQGA